jgi:sortase A
MKYVKIYMSMNPTDDQTNDNGTDPNQRAAATNVIRGQIDQLFGDVTTAPMIDQNPYDRTHAPTSDTAVLPTDDETARQLAHRKAYAEAHRRYHNAWQQYYQKYYERYYMAQMEAERRRYKTGQAAVITDANDHADSQTAASVEPHVMTQREALSDLRGDLLSKIRRGASKVRGSRHFWPAISALVVIALAAFVQYNQLIFAQVSAFVSPGDASGQSIIIGSGADQPVDARPLITIPKINVEAPVIYGLPDLDEATSQNALKNGVIHYPLQGATSVPGENGNTVILGHSSSDLFNDGNFKFIFVQLNRLDKDDLFYINFNSVRYTYKITGKEIINPNEVGKLALGQDKPYATLITCDPPGTALRRLVVYAEQISPDPNAATAPPASEANDASSITGNPPTLFERIFGG